MTLIAVGTTICGHYRRVGGDYTRIGFILGIPGGARSADSRHLLFVIKLMKLMLMIISIMIEAAYDIIRVADA